jgi:GntR family transcriptional regulator
MSHDEPVSFVVQHSSPVAAWGQISRDVLRQIEDGSLPPGARMRTERELAEAYGVSRITVRQALDSLARDGYIVRKQGSGTFVSEGVSTVQHDLGLTGSWRERTADSGLTATSVQIDQSKAATAPADLLAELSIIPDAQEGGWSYLKRLQLVEDAPIGITESWVPHSVAPDIAESPLDNGSLSETLYNRYAIRPALTKNVMQVGIATARQAELLNTYMDAPLYVVRSATETEDGGLAEVSITQWLGNRVKFRYDRVHAENRVQITRD